MCAQYKSKIKKYVNFEKNLPRVKMCGIMLKVNYFIGGKS